VGVRGRQLPSHPLPHFKHETVGVCGPQTLALASTARRHHLRLHAAPSWLGRILSRGPLSPAHSFNRVRVRHFDVHRHTCLRLGTIRLLYLLVPQFLLPRTPTHSNSAHFISLQPPVSPQMQQRPPRHHRQRLSPRHPPSHFKRKMTTAVVPPPSHLNVRRSHHHLSPLKRETMTTMASPPSPLKHEAIAPPPFPSNARRSRNPSSLLKRETTIATAPSPVSQLSLQTQDNDHHSAAPRLPSTRGLVCIRSCTVVCKLKEHQFDYLNTIVSPFLCVCLSYHQCQLQLAINWLRPVFNQTQLRPVATGFLVQLDRHGLVDSSLGPVLMDSQNPSTGPGPGPFPKRKKTGPDRTLKHYT
jgi:hypothetical protein